MVHLIELFVVLVLLTILSGIVSLIAIYAAFAIAQRKRSSDGLALQYGDFFRKSITRRRLFLTLVVVPLAMLALLALASTVEAKYRTSHLRGLADEATILRIRTGGHCHRWPEREVVLFETKEGRAIEDMLDRISLLPSGPIMRCRCCGDMSFELYEGTRLIESFSFHHGTHIRIEGDWLGDRYLSSSSRESLSVWLVEKGIAAKLEQIEEQRRDELSQEKG